MINFVKIDSSMIEEVGYDDEVEEFIVKFWNGSTYIYEGVSKSVYDEFLDSDSKGKFLHLKIKDHYSFRKE